LAEQEEIERVSLQRPV